MNMFASGFVMGRFALERLELRRSLAALIFGGVLTATMVSATWAQMPGSGPTGKNHMIPRTGGGAGEKPAVAAPDAIPGSKPREGAAPPTRIAGDMQPTEALFDAINRGDIAAARDALNRGADQNGANILGLTPMELSVDLGRNDISFLLLSMRGEDSGRGSRAVAGGGPAPGARPVQATKPAAAGAPAVTATAQAVAKPRATPKLFANDGGAPIPSAGFLGFGSRSATN